MQSSKLDISTIMDQGESFTRYSNTALKWSNKDSDLELPLNKPSKSNVLLKDLFIMRTFNNFRFNHRFSF